MALRATGRDILLSACNWGLDNSSPWMRSAGANMYRSTGDIVDNFQSIKDIALSQVDKLCYGAPGCFNDMHRGAPVTAGCTAAMSVMHRPGR